MTGELQIQGETLPQKKKKKEEEESVLDGFMST